MALSGSSSPHFYLARSRSTSLPPLSSTKATNPPTTTASYVGASSSWPFQSLPCLGLAFDDPSFFADLRVDVNPTSTTSPSSPTSRDTPHHEIDKNAENATAATVSDHGDKEKGKLTDDLCHGSQPPHLRLHYHQQQHDRNPDMDHSSPVSREDCVWVHRMVIAVHSPVFRSLLRECCGSRESREGVIDMRGPQHPPGRVVRCMLKMMYASPGLAIDELDKETKLSDEWEFLLQLFKLAHLYQVEVALDACTRRLKHILERKTHHPVSSRPHRHGHHHHHHNHPRSAEDDSEEDDERTRQTCYALELLAFLLHVRDAETRDGVEPDLLATPESSEKHLSADDLGVKEGAGDVSPTSSKREQAKGARASEGAAADEDLATAMMMAVNVGERREDMLVRMLDAHLFPQLSMIVQHIRCEDVLTLQHLLRLSVCRPSPPHNSTTNAASLTHSWAGVRTKSYHT